MTQQQPQLAGEKDENLWLGVTIGSFGFSFALAALAGILGAIFGIGCMGIGGAVMSWKQSKPAALVCFVMAFIGVWIANCLWAQSEFGGFLPF